MKNPLRIFVAAVIILVCAVNAFAASQFSSVIVFGDSLSDNGNYYRLVDKLTPLVPQDGSPPLPYFFGRYSNGPVAVELLASNLGLPLVDFAVGGAMSGLTNEDPRFPRSGVLGQVEEFIAKHEDIDEDALYVVWGGANDFLGATNLATPGVAQAVIANAIGNLTQSIELLYAHGARHFLVPNLPDLGLTPLEQTQAAQATQLALAFNEFYAQALAALGQQMRHGEIHTVDVATLLQKVVADPGTYGFLNATGACVADQTYACILTSFNGEVAAGYLFWDAVHPTASAHELLAVQFAAALASDGSSVPAKKSGDKDWLTRVKEKH